MTKVLILIVAFIAVPKVYATSLPSMEDPVGRTDICITNKLVNTKSTDSCRQQSGLSPQAFNDRVNAQQILIHKLQRGAVTCTAVTVTRTGQVRQSLIGGPDHGLLYKMFAQVISRRGDAVLAFNDCKG